LAFTKSLAEKAAFASAFSAAAYKIYRKHEQGMEKKKERVRV
jgi:hypothetical protein